MKVTRRLRERLGERLGEQLAPVARDLAGQARGRIADQVGGRLGERLAGRIEPHRPPDARGNRPRAAFAGVLDGRHLWLAVDATPGTLALRETGTDKVVPLASDIPEDDPRYRSVRSDLSALPGHDARRFEVVITAPGGKVHRVWTPPLTQGEPVRTPARDGVQWQVARSTDGTLELVREPAPGGALLVDIAIDADDVTTLGVAGAPDGSELRLVDDESGDVLVTLPLIHTPGRATASISPGDVPEGPGLSAKLYAGDLPVRRRDHGLSRPAGAVLLPQVQNRDSGDDAPIWSLVFRWLPDGILRVRRPRVEPADAQSEPVA